MKPEILTDQEIRRFDKQIQLPEIGLLGQEKFKQSEVVVIGAGGLGASTLKYLAATGIGKLGIIDFSLVEESDIQRQTIYGGNDLGKLKTIITRQHLLELFPLVEFTIINLKLTEENAIRVLKPFKLIVDASNDVNTGTIIFEACYRLKLNLVYGRVSGLKGIASSIDPGKEKSWITQIQAGERNYFGETDRTRNGSGIALTYGFMGNLLAMEVAKILTDFSKSLDGKILTMNCFTYELNIKPL